MLAELAGPDQRAAKKENEAWALYQKKSIPGVLG